MSVNYCLIQISPEELKTFGEQASTCSAFVEEMAEHFGLQKLDEPIDRMLYIDEFTKSLLTDLRAIHSPFEPINRALMFPSHVLDYAGYACNGVGFHTVDEVKSLSESLDKFAEANLQALLASRPHAHVQDLQAHFQYVHLLGAESMDDNEAVQQYQRAWFDRVVEFFGKVSRQGDAVLLICC